MSPIAFSGDLSKSPMVLEILVMDRIICSAAQGKVTVIASLIAWW